MRFGRDLKCFIRLDLGSDLFSMLELGVRDTYFLDRSFHPDLVIDGGGNIGLFTCAPRRQLLRKLATGQQIRHFASRCPQHRTDSKTYDHEQRGGRDNGWLPGRDAARYSILLPFRDW